jgi:hypothetical protein
MKELWMVFGVVVNVAVGAPEFLASEPALPTEGLVPATPALVYSYKVKRRVLVTSGGSSETAATESTVRVELQEPNRVILRWERGMEVVYEAVGGDPVAQATDLGRRWVPAIRAHRQTSSGSVESLVITENGFVMTTHSASSFDVVVTYGAATGSAPP